MIDWAGWLVNYLLIGLLVAVVANLTLLAIHFVTLIVQSWRGRSV